MTISTKKFAAGNLKFLINGRIADATAMVNFLYIFFLIGINYNLYDKFLIHTYMYIYNNYETVHSKIEITSLGVWFKINSETKYGYAILDDEC